VDPDPDDLQERPDGLAPGRGRAQAEARAVDHRLGLTAGPRIFPRTAGRKAGRLRYRSGPWASGSAMTLPLHPPFPPMEALSVDAIPAGPEWQYEPKWDGFRCLVFRDGAKIELQSKSGQPLTRYFPELVEAVRSVSADAFVLDGEIVVPHGRAFS